MVRGSKTSAGCGRRSPMSSCSNALCTAGLSGLAKTFHRPRSALAGNSLLGISASKENLQSGQLEWAKAKFLPDNFEAFVCGRDVARLLQCLNEAAEITNVVGIGLARIGLARQVVLFQEDVIGRGVIFALIV